MKFKGIIAAALASMTLAAVPSAFAADVIAPTTAIDNCTVGDLNVLNNIFSYDFGSGEADGNTTIAPTTIVNGVNTNLLNVINTIVNVNCNIDMSDMSDMIASLRADILSNMSK